MDTTEFILPGLSVSALVIATIVLLIALVLPYVSNWLSTKSRKGEKVFRCLTLAVYAGMNLYETLLFRVVRPDAPVKLELMWSYQRAISETTVQSLDGILLNILLYIPFGYLLPYVFGKLSTGKVVLIGALCSAMTEVIQLVFKIGWFDVDDMINNTLGMVIGTAIYYLWIKKKLQDIL